MHILDNLSDYNNIDKNQTLESIMLFSKQCETAYQDASKIEYPNTYHNISNILFCGMGGSAYAGRIIKSLYSDKLKFSVDIVTDYNLPAYVDDRTLIILSSYSGNTQETISCCDQALKTKACIVGITKGGILAQKLMQAKRPTYCFKDDFNPSLQPRLGQGYMIAGQLAILNKLNIININNRDIPEITKLLENSNKLFVPRINFQENIIKKIAWKIKDKIVILVGAQFLSGALHAVQNPIHETGKHLAFYTILPETNHHLMEGLSFPSIIKNNVIFIFINSNLYSPVIQTRLSLTRQVVKKNQIDFLEYKLKFPAKLAQNFELLQFGSFLSYYLAIIHKIDPAKIPYVTYFKKKLQQELRS